VVEASQRQVTKPDGTTAKVDAALVHRQFMFLPGEICATCGKRSQGDTRKRTTPGHQRPSAAGGCSLHVEERGSDLAKRAARRAATHERDGTEVSRGHSSGRKLRKEPGPRRAEHTKGRDCGDSRLGDEARPGQSSVASPRPSNQRRGVCPAVGNF
jgi:hypothetical protein